MLNRWIKLRAIGREKGQSLVETAIFFPILIFILAGAVEVGNLLNTQNKVTTAARSAAGFGAANYDRDDWDGTASAMGQVALNTVTANPGIDGDALGYMVYPGPDQQRW